MCFYIIFGMRSKKAFTLIEMLIAISVFAIGILAVLRVLTGNISVLDRTNIKLQATVLAKEWIELLYNVRDSNLEKNLSWNCVLNREVYDWTLEYLNNYNDDPESSICTWYFSVDTILKLSFDEKYYLYQALAEKKETFDDLFKDNRLCLYRDESKNFSRYAYCSENGWWEETIFARYLSFSPVNVSDSADSTTDILPVGKILKVESHVLYDKMGNTWDIVFESFIWNY